MQSLARTVLAAEHRLAAIGPTTKKTMVVRSGKVEVERDAFFIEARLVRNERAKFNEPAAAEIAVVARNGTECTVVFVPGERACLHNEFDDHVKPAISRDIETLLTLMYIV